MIRSSATFATARAGALALVMGAVLLAGCGAKSDQEQAAAAQAAAERAEAAALRAEKAAGMVSKATNVASSSSEADAESENNDEDQAVAGPPQPSEEDVRRAVEEAESR